METDLTADVPSDRLGMTDAQWEQFQAYTHGYGEQNEYGIDPSLLRENLQLTPTQRLERHQRALRLFLEVQRAGRDARRSQYPGRPGLRSSASGKIQP